MPQYKVVHVTKNDSAFKQDRSVPERAEATINELVAEGWTLELFRPYQAGTIVFQVLLLFKRP